MPGYRTHVTAGVGAFSLVLLTLPNAFGFGSQYMIDGLVAVILGSLFPDIDTKSKGQKTYAVILMMLFAYCMQQGRYDYLPIVCIMLLFPLSVAHRGITHNPWFIVCMAVAIGCVGVLMFNQDISYMIWFLSCFSGAALLHILLDVGIVRFWRKCACFRVK